MPFAIISDDLTGTADAGVYAVIRGQPVRILVDRARTPEIGGDGVACINMSSRVIPGAVARNRHIRVGTDLARLPQRVLMKKMDTGFRGNAAYEIEGLLAGLGATLCFVVDNWPAVNTFTLYGHQYVQGQILPKSIYAQDPLKAPVKSSIPEILAQDTTLPIGQIDIDAIKGCRLRQAVAAAVAAGKRLLVFDAVTREDGLAIVRELMPVYPRALWAGSLGLAEALTTHLFGQPQSGRLRERQAAGGTRCAGFTASAYEVTREQIVRAGSAGLVPVDLDIDRMLAGDDSALDEAIERCVAASSKTDFMLRPKVGAGGAEWTDLSHRILEAMTACALRILPRIDYDRLVIVGGETSQALCDALEIRELALTEEIEPAVAAGTIIDGACSGREFALKGGSVGSPGAIIRMCLKEGTNGRV